VTKKRVQCTHPDCKKWMVEDYREYEGRKAWTNNKVYTLYFICPDGHTNNWKEEILGTANDPDD